MTLKTLAEFLKDGRPRRHRFGRVRRHLAQRLNNLIVGFFQHRQCPRLNSSADSGVDFAFRFGLRGQQQLELATVRQRQDIVDHGLKILLRQAQNDGIDVPAIPRVIVRIRSSRHSFFRRP